MYNRLVLMAEARIAVENAEERCRIAEEQENTVRQELGARCETLETEVEKLRAELATANELLGKRQQEQLEAQASEYLSPTAAAVARVQKSGKTFTEIVSVEYYILLSSKLIYSG
jgi:hypothetical protein